MSGAILVTGATGFIGRHLVEALRARGERVVALGSKDGNLAFSEPAACGARHVYHLAARTFVPESREDPRRYFETNVLGAINVLEFCRKSGASLTLLSSYLYGHPKILPVPEDHSVAATNPYAHTKLIAEQVAGYYRTYCAVPITMVRCFNIYGPGQASNFLIPTIIRQAIDPSTTEIAVEDDEPRRDYLYISDLVALLLRLDHARGGVFNAGSGKSWSVREVSEIVIRLTGNRKHLVSAGKRRPGEMMDVFADIRHAAEGLHWRPSVELEEGLRQTIEWTRQHGRIG